MDDFDSIFFSMRELGAIDTSPWGKVRRLPDGAMQMFIRDPAGNLIEISCPAEVAVDEAIFGDDLVDAEGPALRVESRRSPRPAHRGRDALPRAVAPGGSGPPGARVFRPAAAEGGQRDFRRVRKAGVAPES